MGGRIDGLIVDEAEVVCLGYPSHLPGKPDRIRTKRLLEIATPTLKVQGERDKFGNVAEVLVYLPDKLIGVK